MPRKLDESRRLRERAEKLIPGGVNSPVRAFKAVECDTPFIVRGQGSHTWDADGNQYLDYVGSWGPLILGHAEPDVIEAILSAAVNGTSFGASTPSEAELAELLSEAFPHIQKIRFVSSGTEATMSAIRLARAYTKRKYVIKFEGCYHGHADSLLVKAGSGIATLGIPGSAGVLEEVSQFTIALPFNDTEVLEQAFSKYRHQIACVIVEPVVGNMGCVPASGEYLANLRTVTQREKTLLIFDEVMTGFRVAYGGAQELYGITPDLTTLGKIIGGGFAVGAVAGRADILDLSAPERGGRVTHAGTFNANPITSIAGRVTMETLTPAAFAQMNALGDYARARLAEVTRGLPLQVTGAGSLFKVTATDRAIRDYRDAATTDKAWEATCSLALLNEGFVLTPTMSGCISYVTTREHVDALVSAFQALAGA